MNGLNNLDETYVEYSVAPTDDLIRFWESKVKVTAGPCEGIHVEVHPLKLRPYGGVEICVLLLLLLLLDLTVPL